MQTQKEQIEKHFEKCKGDVQVGDVVAHQSHKITHTLNDIIKGIGFCSTPDGEKNQWPINELADPNKVKLSIINSMIKDALTTNRLN